MSSPVTAAGRKTTTEAPHEDRQMTAATTKPKAKNGEPSSPPTFADIARRKMAERIEAYRLLVKRQAAGDTLQEADLTTATECLEALGLPDYSWPLHVEAMQRHVVATAKLKAAEDAAAPNRERSLQLGKDIEAARQKLQMLMEERRKAEAAASKGGAYWQTVGQLESEHPVVLADIDTAVTLRLDELNKRRARA